LRDLFCLAVVQIADVSAKKIWIKHGERSDTALDVIFSLS